MMTCKHDEHYEIGVDYLSVQTFERKPDGETAWDDGSPTLYGTFSFHCHVCGLFRHFRSDTKRPQWLAARIAALGIDALK